MRVKTIFTFLTILISVAACQNQSLVNNKPPTQFGESIRIGLFLPLNHKSQNVREKAKQYFNSAKLAAEDLRPIPLEIILYETDGTLQTIKTSVSRAINDNIQIALGTLDNNETIMVKNALRNSGKKLLSFSAYEAFLGRNIFHMGIGRINLAEQILEYTINEGYNTFLILEGANKEADLDLSNLKRIIDKKNGAILKNLKVSEKSEFINEVKDTIERFQSDNRKEAVIILGTPDQNMVFTLASLKEVMSENDGTAIQVIALSRWAIKNNLLTEAALTKIWFPFLNKDRVSEFFRRYHALYGSKPSIDSAIAYDSVAVIGALIKNNKEPISADLFKISSLTNPSGFLGVLGTFRFLRNGSSERLLGVAESQLDGIKVLKNPPKRF